MHVSQPNIYQENKHSEHYKNATFTSHLHPLVLDLLAAGLLLQHSTTKDDKAKLQAP